ncbi:hypothetical protein BpHYR1_051283 [Brachionus plicatilis]|uniref:Uncharacterized protein n=1 Tax=Brachionus plicatilis TaxID=10195 RepID=A0A3M7S835_BRAPC|nr:hypothetical protein BpHYR1_051283 [Brachionus plicatilis]
MHFLNKLKIISLIVICVLANALILDGFLYFKNFQIADGFVWKYRMQEIVCLGAIFGAFYLIVTIFMNEFLIVNSHSKYSDHYDFDEDEPHFVEKIFLSIIPILCFCAILIFTIQLLFFSSHYVAGKNLYHKTPAEFIKMKIENKDKTITVLFSSIKDKVKSKLFGVNGTKLIIQSHFLKNLKFKNLIQVLFEKLSIIYNIEICFKSDYQSAEREIFEKKLQLTKRV